MKTPFITDPEELRKVVGDTEEIYSKGLVDGLRRGFRAGVFATLVAGGVVGIIYFAFVKTLGI